MDEQITKFLENHRIAVLTTTSPDGSLHSAAVHFAYSERPFAFYFVTEVTTRKVSGLLKGEETKASLVIGFSEEEWKTLQASGTTVIATNQALVIAQKAYYSKYPDGEKYKDDPDSVMIKFTPDWWRYTDFKQKPKKTISSET